MCVRRCLAGLTFCTCYLASYLTNKYVLSVLKFTYPTLFQGWQTLIGGLLLHVSWKLGWAEINSSSRSDVSTWLPASVLFVGIIYAGSRALSKLAIPVFLTLHNVAEVILCGHQKCFQKEWSRLPGRRHSFQGSCFRHPFGSANKTSPAKICSALFLLAAAGCLPFNDPQFDPGGYFWAVIHLFCVGAYKILQKAQKPNALSDIDQQYLNYTFSVVLLALASHPTGDLFSVLDFPFLYFYRFHGSCCASGLLGFFLMLSTVKLKSLMAPGQCAAWIFFAKVITAGSSVLLFDTILTSATVGCLMNFHKLIIPNLLPPASRSRDSIAHTPFSPSSAQA
ncbi:transmembrane protein 241 isoform X7 [Ursus maritimus]|uniref:Transmembrane protein 241 isoform X7 n=1 Tax=Ursus maritimus TaxID=29073 RepID=A0A8M1G1E3_URSMA|nr:transmembrane protein 241 isoform X7 [Ursus maritimus]